MDHFKQTLLNIRNDEIHCLMEAHDTELRQCLEQVNLDAMRMDLYQQAGRLDAQVFTACEIDLTDFSRRHRAFLNLKKVHDSADAYRFYSSYHLVVRLMERLRAEFTGMVVAFDVTDTAFVFQVYGNLALTQGGTGDVEGCSTHDERRPAQS